jgi:hypothetical protein
MRALRISFKTAALSLVTPLAATLAATVALSGLAPYVAAVDVAEFGTPNQEYLDQKAELQKLVESRDTDLYELNFEPLDMDEVSLKDRLGNLHVYTYLTFRLRNEIKDSTRPEIAKPSRYNEILKSITEQYEGTKIEGAGLSIGGEKGSTVIVEREDLKPRTRKVNITVIAYNEHGTRIQLLDDPVGTGEQNNFNFQDYGELSHDDVFKRVREEVEEKANRRLLTVDEIRVKELPPFDPNNRNEEGVANGEAFGVVLFNRLSVYGDKITVEVRGLSNKFRQRKPETKAGEVENYALTRYLRRVYVLNYVRPGDEYFRHLDRFELVKGGYDWVNTFQRLEQRKAMAYSKFFNDNITDLKDQRQSAVEDDAWKYYGDVRAAYPNAAAKLPDLKATLKDRTDQ